MSELDRNLPYPPVDFALTCSPEQFTAMGFDKADIVALFKWQDGLDPDATKSEIRRFKILETLVARTVT